MDKDFEIKLRKFLEEKPLYSWMNIELPEYGHQFCNLNRIEMQCGICKTSRPYTDREARGGGMGMSTPKLESTTYGFYFTCDGCSSSKYAFYIDVDVERKRIRKVGQNPPWSINSDNDLERFLDEDYEYFKKAMICESQGYGIAAFAYYRRVVENSINKILETLKVVLEAQNAEPGKIQKIEEALKGTIMDERIRIAKDAVPGSLRPNNINPLGVIYDTLSAGIHRLTEEECLDNSVHIRGSISYLIKMLVKQSEEQKIFLEAMKNLHDFNSSST